MAQAITKEGSNYVITGRYKNEFIITAANYETPIGKGSFGKVFKATLKGNKNPDQLFAIKQIMTKSSEGFDQLGTKREIQILLDLKGESNGSSVITHILYLVDIAGDNEAIYLIMPFMNAWDLNKYLIEKTSEGHLEEGIIIEIMRQFLKGMKVMRGHKLIHRDLKPQNLFMRHKTKEEKNNRDQFPCYIYVGDFGTSKKESGLNEQSTMNRGTLTTIAPEVYAPGAIGASFSSYDGSKADIYSVGCILCKLINSTYPMTMMDHAKINGYFINANYKCSEFLSYIMEGCLQVQPSDRLTFEELFNLFNITNSEIKEYSDFIYFPYSTVDQNRKINLLSFTRKNLFTKEEYLKRMYKESYCIQCATLLKSIVEEPKSITNEKIADLPENTVQKPESPKNPHPVKAQMQSPIKKENTSVNSSSNIAATDLDASANNKSNNKSVSCLLLTPYKQYDLYNKIAIDPMYSELRNFTESLLQGKDIMITANLEEADYSSIRSFILYDVKINSQMIERIGKSLPREQIKIYFVSCLFNVSNEELANLLQTLQPKGVLIKEFDAENIQLNNVDIISVLAPIVNCLEDLHLENLGLTCERVSELNDLLNDHNSLLKLSFASNNFLDSSDGDDVLLEIMNKCPKLQYLNLSKTITNMRSGPFPSDIIANIGRLTDLKQIALNKLRLKDKEVVALISSLKKCKQLSTISLGGNSFKLKLLDDLKVASGIDYFDVSSIVCNDDTNSIEHILSSSKSIRTLELSNLSLNKTNCVNLFKVFSNLKQLRSLNLAINSIGDSGLDELLSSLVSLQNIESLVLTDDEISNEGAKALGPILHQLKSIVVLDLSINKIFDKGIKFMFPDLGSNRLRILNLSSMKLLDDGVLCVSQYIAKINTLASLRLSNNELQGESMPALTKALKNNADFSELDISINPNISTKCLALYKILFEHCPNLKKLVAANCNIDDSNFIDLVHSLKDCPYFSMLDITGNNKISDSSMIEMKKNLSEYLVELSLIAPKDNNCIIQLVTALAGLKHFRYLRLQGLSKEILSTLAGDHPQIKFASK